MVNLYNISNWNEQIWWNTGGTRDKKIYLNPKDNELYYFKQSFKKGQRDYIYEFWSEIIASEIGLLLGFDVLKYDIAIRGSVVGCISKSMIKAENEELVEGGKYLQAHDNTFNPENIKERHRYTLDLIIETLIAFHKNKHLDSFFETIVFDALIGNSDRHQENWAIINKHTILTGGIRIVEENLETGEIENIPKWIKAIIKKLYTIKGRMRPEFQNAKLMMPRNTKFAPIYDSGCSFGRELNDNKVKTMLSNKEELEKYINNGKAEIHIDEKKLNHFELLEHILKDSDLKEYIISPLDRIINNYDKEKVSKILSEIDIKLIQINNHNIFPSQRKELVLKLLNLRFKKLNELHKKYK